MFREEIDLPKEDLNIVFNAGGLGDALCRMVAVKFLRDTQPHLRLHVYVPDYFLDVAKNLVPDIEIRSFTNIKERSDLVNPKFAGRNTDESAHTLMATHLVDQAFHILVDQQVDVKYKNYIPLNLNPISIKQFNLPENYVVITTGFTAEVREMKPQVVNELADYIISKGYKVVFLGQKNTTTGTKHIIKGKFSPEIDFTKGINLVDRTTLLEAGKILAGAKAVVGLDCGLIHLAGSSDTNIVAGFTTVIPEHRAIQRNNSKTYKFFPVVPPESLKCSGCQSRWAHVYNLDFRTCFYKNNGYDNEIQCVKLLTSDLYIKELEKVL